MRALADLQLPTADAEIWRYSRIAELDISAFTIQRGSLDVSGDASVFSTDAEADSTI